MSKATVFSGRYFRIFLTAVIVIPVILLIARNIGFFGNALLVLLGFGAVVIVHEFGHFIVAKLSDIKVEAFSLFMPPMLLGVQKTEQGIRIRILPEILPKQAVLLYCRQRASTDVRVEKFRRLLQPGRHGLSSPLLFRRFPETCPTARHRHPKIRRPPWRCMRISSLLIFGTIYQIKVLSNGF